MRGGTTVVRTTTVACALVAVATLSADVHAQQASAADSKALNLSAYVELLRSDLRTTKVAIITEVMGFSEKEDAAFWPIYRDYELAMAKLGDERVALIESYASGYSKMTDALAETLASRALDLQSRRQAALASCYEKVKKALSPTTALRFLQVEHQLLLLIDLQIAASLPVAQ